MKTCFLGKRIDYYESIDSTHLEAKRLKKIENGMIILANNQTDGIGTHSRKWYTVGGKNLLLDIILIPNCDIKKIEGLTLIIAKCMVTILKELYGIELSIKEPNDIMCNNKKLAGILTEAVTRGDIVQKLYIGIGLNINQISFPKELESIATSLKNELNKELNREEILIKFLEEFEKEYIKIIQK